jgi:Xaa-Pro aminopeptidase
MTSTPNYPASKAEQPKRLNELRGVLAAQKLDGFFVPLSDEYMNEYVPDSAQRLAWLTGFTGSAGMALVLTNKAALFIDGRYTIQAAQQVDDSLYELRHITRNPVTEYLKKHVQPGQRIGYDPWLHSAPWLERMREVMEPLGAKLIALSFNLIDTVWKDRPAVPSAPVFIHPMDYAGEASGEKRKRLGAQLAEKGLAGAVITNPASIAWLLNVRGGDVESTPLPLSYAILHASGTVDWFIHPGKISPEVKSSFEGTINFYPQDHFIKALKDLGGKQAKLRVNLGTAPSAVVDALKDSGAVVDKGEDPCELPKALKNKAEIAGMRDAHRRDGLALTKFLFWLDANAPGGKVSEMIAEEKLLEFRKGSNHFLYPSFNSISGAGPNGAIVHYRSTTATNRTLSRGEFYLIDSGGQYPDGTTDVTRTIAIGDVTPEMREHYTRVLKGHIALARAVFPAGTSGSQLDVLARQYLWQAGLDYDHGTGHGVGAFLGVHEGPQNISSRSSVALQPGMVISNEPGYYRENAYGIRIENLVTVKEADKKIDGRALLEFETLTLAPFDQRGIDKSMLTRDEKAWLNSYHAAVFEAHQDKLSGGERAWLEEATKPV